MTTHERRHAREIAGHVPARLQHLIDNPRDLIPDDLSEVSAMAVLRVLAERFGWQYAVWIREDAEHVLSANPHVAPEERRLTTPQWERVIATGGWRSLSDRIDTFVHDSRVIEESLLEAGLECVRCQLPLDDAPGVTGRLCGDCRVGPAGQPVAVDPGTAELYWLDEDALMRAPVGTDFAPRFDQALPVEGDDLAAPGAVRARAVLVPLVQTPEDTAASSE